jgi:membrane-associated phospholipid phosphatase
LTAACSRGRSGRSSSAGPARRPSQWRRRRLPGTRVALVVAGLVTAQVWWGGELASLDRQVQRQVAAARLPGFARLGLIGVSELGGRALGVSLLLAVALLAARRSGDAGPVRTVGFAVVLLMAVVEPLKIAVGRTAPAAGVLAVGAGGRSFPSGHAANAVVVWGLVARLVPVLTGRARCRRLARAAAVVLPGLVGAAMLALGFHWLTDLLGRLGRRRGGCSSSYRAIGGGT